MMYKILCLVLISLFTCISAACSLPEMKSERKNAALYSAAALHSAEGTPRAAPAYVQWLEKQSLLRNSVELTRIVSGSALGWQFSSVLNQSPTLLSHADVWLDLNPQRLLFEGSSSMFQALSHENVPGLLAGLGVHGLLLNSVTEAGDSWNIEVNTPVNGAEAPMSLHGPTRTEQSRNAVSFQFSAAAGTQQEFDSLAQLAEQHGVLLGGDALPMATGQGADFFLATRGVRDFPGLYMLTEIPREQWGKLPQSETILALQPEETSSLVLSGLLPPAFSCDTDPQALPGGWAATGPILGVDGVTRRFVYRYSGSVNQAVLNWDDPSGVARRVASAGLIRQVGVLRQPLVGLRIQALWGLDAAPENMRTTGEPALLALHSLGREARRYGGFSLLRDTFSLENLALLQASAVDFVSDSVLSPALELALISGDTKPLRQAIDSALAAGIDFSRLWRSTPNGEGLAVGEKGQALQASVPPEWQRYAPFYDQKWYASAPTVAALAAGLKPDDILYKGKKLPPEKLAELADIHMLQLAFRAMQPGLWLLSGPDLSGATFALSATAVQENPALGAWSLGLAFPPSTLQGLPRAETVYSPVPVQLTEAESVVQGIALLVKLRTQSQVAQGKVLAQAKSSHESALSVLSALPGGKLLLLTVNCSAENYVAELSLPAGLLAEKPGLDLVSGKGVRVERNTLKQQLKPWGFRVVQLEKAGMN